jgi:hypothetical protein
MPVRAREWRPPWNNREPPGDLTMNAVLALEDGTWYRGIAAGASGEARGEVVFNTPSRRRRGWPAS